MPIVTGHPARTAAQIVTEAINAAHAAGITITTGRRLGVACPSSVKPHWERQERGVSLEAVSPLGAVLLKEQPENPIADEALAQVLGSKVLFHIGIEDGTEGLPPSENLQRGPDAQLYRDGWQLGQQVRLLLCTERCEPHNVRHLRGERCHACAAGVPVLRLVEDPTQPIATDPEV